MHKKLDEVKGVEIIEEEEKKEELQVEISEVSFTGSVKINYSKPVVSRSVLNDLPEEILKIDFLSEAESKQTMSFNFTEFESTTLTLQISFSSPTEVSQGEG